MGNVEEEEEEEGGGGGGGRGEGGGGGGGGGEEEEEEEEKKKKKKKKKKKEEEEKKKACKQMVILSCVILSFWLPFHLCHSTSGSRYLFYLQRVENLVSNEMVAISFVPLYFRKSVFILFAKSGESCFILC